MSIAGSFFIPHGLSKKDKRFHCEKTKKKDAGSLTRAASFSFNDIIRSD